MIGLSGEIINIIIRDYCNKRIYKVTDIIVDEGTFYSHIDLIINYSVSACKNLTVYRQNVGISKLMLLTFKLKIYTTQ